MGLMRELGLILHHMVKPVNRPAAEDTGLVYRSQRVQEAKCPPNLTLRRTTIDEVRTDPPAPHPSNKPVT